MSLTKATGQMYGWITHMHSHLRGACPHRCSYCYVKSTTAGRMGLYDGPLKLAENTLKAKYDSKRIRLEASQRGLDHPVIFIDHMNDLWADDMPAEWIDQVLAQCRKYPDAEYVFQTKNPWRYNGFLPMMPPNRILGCTIETDISPVTAAISKAPAPSERARAMRGLSLRRERLFVTIEPILQCDPFRLASMIADIRSEFVNIGADSKGHNLLEPGAAEINELIAGIRESGIEIREKHNLGRLLDAEAAA